MSARAQCSTGCGRCAAERDRGIQGEPAVWHADTWRSGGRTHWIRGACGTGGRVACRAPAALFHKADLGPGPELPATVADALADPQQRVVGVVHNAVDAQLAGSDQMELTWSAEALRPLPALLRIARDAGRVIVVTGDHGHIVEDGSPLPATVSGSDGVRLVLPGKARFGSAAAVCCRRTVGTPSWPHGVNGCGMHPRGSARTGRKSSGGADPGGRA